MSSIGPALVLFLVTFAPFFSVFSEESIYYRLTDKNGKSVVCREKANSITPGRFVKGGRFKSFTQLIKVLKTQLQKSPSNGLRRKLRDLKIRRQKDRQLCLRRQTAPPSNPPPPSPTSLPSSTPTLMATGIPTSTASSTPTLTATPNITATSNATRTRTPTPTATRRSTATPTSIPTATRTKTPSPTATSTPEGPFLAGFNRAEQSTLVIAYSDTRDPLLSEDLAEIEDRVFGPNGSINSYTQQESNGETWLSGTVVGPIMWEQEWAKCPTTAEIESRARPYVPDFRVYKKVIYISGIKEGRTGLMGQFGSISPWCGGRSTAPNLRWTPDGNAVQSQTWLSMNESRSHSLQIGIHEFGHSLGALHPGFANCPGYFGENKSGCIFEEYWNPLTPVGCSQYPAPPLTVTERRMFGFISPENETRLVSEGVYELKASHLSSGRLRLVTAMDSLPEIFKSEAGLQSGFDYVLELRQPRFAGDSPNFTCASPRPAGEFRPFGVMLTVGAFEELPTSGFPHQLDLLIDTNLGRNATEGSYDRFQTAASEIQDSLMLAGDGYFDTDQHYGFNVRSIQNDTAEIEFMRDSTSCRRARPELLVLGQNPPQVTGAGQEISYTLQVSNHDSTICGSSTYDLLSVLPANWVIENQHTSLTLAPNESRELTVSLQSDPSILPGTYEVELSLRNSQFWGLRRFIKLSYRIHG